MKPFFYLTKKSSHRFKYLENEKGFWGEIESILKGLSFVKNCLRPESTLLIVFDLIFVKAVSKKIMHQRVNSVVVNLVFW